MADHTGDLATEPPTNTNAADGEVRANLTSIVSL